MGVEIYYTSATEGLKRGTSGFCTVGATENIPKALWDRLETLSAYRHVGAEAGVQPVSFGHWILTVTGRTYHVLSRVGDAGMDHTQRTNSFAHHLVLEQAEMERAAAGPAWLLAQAGVMTEAWDGQVGNLPARFLPGSGGDLGNGAQACRRWQEVTGDAGWGGQLAEIFAKTPAKPVCILFGGEVRGGLGGGEGMLELLGEAIALLPPAARWNVTFNTYFTSMPTSATCAWRCCLAGTPAAELGKRYAAGGLILDLTDRSRLPAIGGGVLVEAARTGHLPEAPRPAKPGANIGASSGASPGSKGGAMERGALAREKAAGPVVRAPESAGFGGAEPDAGGTLDFAHDEGGASEREATASPGGAGSWGGSLPPARPTPDVFAPAAFLGGKSKKRRPADAGVPGRAQWALDAAERAAADSVKRRRQQVMGLFIGALAAIGIGTAFVYLAHRHMTPPPDALPLPVKNGPPGAGASPDQANAVNTNGMGRGVGAAEPEVVIPVETEPAIVTPESEAHPQIVPAPPAPPVVHYPTDLTLLAALELPSVGTGIGRRTQTIGLNAADLHGSEKVSKVRLIFPRTGPGDDGNTTSADGAEFRNQDSGTLKAEPMPPGGPPAVKISWKPAGVGGGGGARDGAEVLVFGFDKSGPGVNLDWRTATLLRNPQMIGYYYWMMQSSVLELETGSQGGSGADAAQRVHFKAFDAPVLNFMNSSMDAAWPADLPKGVVAVPPVAAAATGPAARDSAATQHAPAGLPDGWTASWYTDWEQKDAAMRTADNALQVIKFKKGAASGLAEAWFLVTFHPGFTRIESTFAKRRAADKAEIERLKGELAALDQRIVDANAVGRGVTTQPVPPELQANRDQTAAVVTSYNEVIDAYDGLSGFDVGVELPGKVRLVTLHFARTDDKAGK